MISAFIKSCAIVVEYLWKFLFILPGYLNWVYYNFKPGLSDSLNCLSGKTAIVTGGNAGIGLMTTKLLASRGCRVIIACRSDASKAIAQIKRETNNPNITDKRLDLSKLASVRQFAENIKKEETKIDILINNAGVGYSDHYLSEDGLNYVMQTNYLGHFLLTHLLIDLLKVADDARIAFLTSGLSIMSQVRVSGLYPASVPTTWTRFQAYADSKLLCILAAQEMAKKLEKFRIRVNAADPGLVRTTIFDVLEGEEEGKSFIKNVFNLLIFLFSGDLMKSGHTSLHLATSTDVGSGLCYFRCLPLRKSRILNNQDLCRELWEETEKIVKLQPEERL